MLSSTGEHISPGIGVGMNEFPVSSCARTMAQSEGEFLENKAKKKTCAHFEVVFDQQQ